MLVSLSRSSFDFMSGIFDSSSQFWFSYACGDSFTHPFNPPNLGGENEPTWSYVAWLFWIPFECAPTIHVAQLFGKSCETRAHWIFSPDQLIIKPKMEKEFYERSCCFLISTDSCQWCACHFMSQIFNMPMFLIFLFRRLGVDGCASQPPSRLLLCLGFAVCYATFCLVLFSALACTWM